MKKDAEVTFEDALTMTGFGKLNYFAFFQNLIVVTSVTFEFLSVAYLVPASACDLNTTILQQGLIAGSPLIGIITTCYLWGYLGDTKGRRKIILWSLCCGFFFGSLAAFSPNWITLLFLKLLSYTALAGGYPLAITLVSEMTPLHRRSIFVSGLNSQIFVSSGIMAILSIPILRLKLAYEIPFLNITFQSWRLLSLIFTAPCAIGAVVMYFSYESPRFLVRIGEQWKAIEVLKGMYRINTGKSRDDYKVQSIVLGEAVVKSDSFTSASFSAQVGAMFRPPLLKNTLMLASLFIICFFGMQPFLMWLPYISDAVMRFIESGDTGKTFCEMMSFGRNQTYIKNHDCTLNHIAMTSVFSIYMYLSVLNVVFSTNINIIGKRRLLIVMQLLSGTSGFFLIFSRQYIISTLLFILYITSSMNFSYLSIYTVEMYPTHVKAMAVCLSLTIGRGSSALGINLLKSLLAYNCEMSFYFYGTLAFCGGLISVLLPSDTKIAKSVEVEPN